jgi:hypothetical protein
MSTTDPAPLQARRRLLALLAGLLTLGLAALFAHYRDLGEGLYGRGEGPWIAYGLSRLTGWIPFSVAEPFVAVIVVCWIVGAVRAVRRAVRRERPWCRTFAAGALRVGQDAGLLIAAFYLLWGFNYGRLPVEERWGWPAPASGEARDPQVLAALAEELVTRTNDAYVALHGVEDLGQPTPPPLDLGAFEAAVEEGWRRLSKVHPLDAPAGRTYGRAKRPLLAGLMSRGGISGIYFPYTGEANVNRRLPAATWGRVIAHEKAHQRGFAPENEANFLGYLAAVSAPSPHARYSAYFFAHRQLLRALLLVDPETAQGLLEERLPGVQRDVDDLHDYWRRYQGAMRNFSHSVNDAYLRSHRVEGGVLSYGRSVDLLLRYVELHGGPEPGTTGDAGPGFE